MSWGDAPKPTTENVNVSPINDGDYVLCMLLDRKLPKKSEEAIKLLEDNGEIPNREDWAKWGMAFDVAIIAKGKTKDLIDQKLIDAHADDIKLPNGNIFNTIKVYPPSLAKEAKYIMEKCIRPDLSIESIYPSPFPARDFKTKKLVTDVEPEEKEMYADLLIKEQDRVNDWNNLITWWETLAPEEKHERLEELLQMQYLIAKVDWDKKEVNYLPLDKGTIFAAKAVKSGKYINLKTVTWDKQNRKWDIHSNGAWIGDFDEIDSTEIADKLIEARKQSFVNKAKKSKTSIVDSLPEETPF